MIFATQDKLQEVIMTGRYPQTWRSIRKYIVRLAFGRVLRALVKQQRHKDKEARKDKAARIETAPSSNDKKPAGASKRNRYEEIKSEAERLIRLGREKKK